MKTNTIAMAGALLIGGLLTLNSIAFADTVDTKTSASVLKRGLFEKLAPGNMGEFDHKGQKDMIFIQKEDWSLKLKALVAEGTINQATADKMQAYLTEQENTMKAEMDKLQGMTAEQRKTYFESNKSELVKKVDILNDMVEKGILTQQQADAIKVIQQTKQAEEKLAMQAKHLEYTTAALNKLVESKVITSEQLIKINEYVAKEQAAKTAEMEKIKAMTDEEATAYFKSNAGSKDNMLAPLVASKVLTQVQADAVEKVLHSKGAPMGFGKDFVKGMIKR
jgi:Tfp pilus assembly protein PilP